MFGWAQIFTQLEGKKQICFSVDIMQRCGEAEQTFCPPNRVNTGVSQTTKFTYFPIHLILVSLELNSTHPTLFSLKQIFFRCTCTVFIKGQML